MGDVLKQQPDRGEEVERRDVLAANRAERMQLSNAVLKGDDAFALPDDGPMVAEELQTPETRVEGWRYNFKAWMNRTLDTHTNEKDILKAKEFRGTPISEYPHVYHDTKAEDIGEEPLPAETFARYYEGKEKGPLVVLILGHRQQIDGNNGFNEAYAFAVNSGYSVILFEVGQYLARPRGVPEQQTDVMYEHGLNIIESFADPKKHTTIVAMGHSWGGGTLARALEKEGEEPSDLERRTKGIPIAETAYIDPVQLGSRKAGFALSSVPQHEGKHTHVYQGADDWKDTLNVFNIDGRAIEHASPRVTQKRFVGADHFDIDEKSLPLMKEIIRRVALPETEGK